MRYEPKKMAASALRADSTLSPTLDTWFYLVNTRRESDSKIILVHLQITPESSRNVRLGNIYPFWS